MDSDKHSATLSKGTPGVLHGFRTYLLQSVSGQITETHSISAGLDYPGVGPEHAWLKDSGRAEYAAATDEQALRAFRMLTQSEGIIPALESCHAIWEGVRLASTMSPDQDIVIVGVISAIVALSFLKIPSVSLRTWRQGRGANFAVASGEMGGCLRLAHINALGRLENTAKMTRSAWIAPLMGCTVYYLHHNPIYIYFCHVWRRSSGCLPAKRRGAGF